MDAKYHIIYRTHNLINGKEYTGKHSTNKLNDGYYGSGRIISCALAKHGKENFAVEILSYHPNEIEAYAEEAKIIDEEYISRSDTYNVILGGTGNFKGMTTVVDVNGKCSCVSISDPRYLSGELVGVCFGKVNVRDKSGNCLQVSRDDPRYLSGELVSARKGAKNPGHNKGKIAVKDKDGNNYQVDKDDSRYLSGELVGVMKGRVFNTEKLTCPHCNKVGQVSNMKRWHMDNCKLKKHPLS